MFLVCEYRFYNTYNGNRVNRYCVYIIHVGLKKYDRKERIVNYFFISTSPKEHFAIPYLE